MGAGRLSNRLISEKMKTSNLIYCIATTIMLILASCESIKDTYEEFIKDGEIIYVAKADSIKIRSGKNRLELSWLLLSDPNVSRYKVFWNNNKDSIENSVTKTSEIDTVRLLLENMEEGIHHFSIFLYDEKGNSSIRATAIGKVYGDRYQSSLLNRIYKSVSRINSKDIVVEWMPADKNVIGIKSEFLDNNNILNHHFSSGETILDTIKNFPIEGVLKYRTAFLPEAMAIDTFYANYENIPAPFYEVKCDKTLWKNVGLSDDSDKGLFLPAWDISNLWDDGENFFYQRDGYIIPNWITIDLGVKYKLTKMKINQLSHNDFWKFGDGSPKEFEIWATNTPTTNWGDWNLIGTFESVKPSGLPIGQFSEQDYAVNLAGEDYNFIPMTDAFRYIRFKTVRTWGGNNYMCLKELTLWGQPVDN